MDTSAMSALSLQNRLAGLQPTPAAVAVDPRGFKSALQSFIQFLIAHDVSATLWLKLPKDDAWWGDIWQYGQQAAGCTIYTLGEQTGTPPDTLAASLRPIPIEPGPELKREYLCLAVAENFMGALLAARVAPGLPTPDKRTLQLYSSTAARTMTALSAGIKHIVEHSLPDREMAVDFSTDLASCSEREIAGAAALSQWERIFPTSTLNQSVLPLSEAFLTWQMQFQEDLRSQIAEYRNSAQNEGNSTQGEALVSPDFLSQAGRKLQAPLTTIKTALTLLGSPTLKLAQRQRYLEMIATQCSEQKELIDSIIELLQLQTAKSTQVQSIQLADLIPGIVSTYQPIAEECGVMLAYTVPQTLAAVSGMEAELKQVLIHLINNGIQMTPKGGRVWVSAAPQGNRFIALTVKDSGEGIAKTDIKNLFEAFYQVPGNTNGTGLGLTLVRKLVQHMGGSISVDSTPNHGTSFKVLLPVDLSAGSHTAASKSVPADDTTKNRTLSSQTTVEQSGWSNVDKKQVGVNHEPVNSSHAESLNAVGKSAAVNTASVSTGS
ncbi:MAG: ATP-binding protein [Cyanobacteria bacterium P01_D01_bin.36]